MRGVSLPLSILDLTPVSDGSTAADAVGHTLDLARQADAWGYHRYWLAEHHNTPGMACPSPEVLIGHVATATRRIRVGAGGIMLPNHSPLHVAESFRLLEAIHPGRIDLGLGRAPGTDGVTAHALRRGAPGADDFPTQLATMFAFVDGGFPSDHPYASVTAQPVGTPLPPVWILGSSDFGAQVAAEFGLGFAFARHLNPRGATDATALYRQRFRPSPQVPEPRVIMATGAIVADDDAHARHLAMSMALGVIRMRQGRPSTVPTPEVAAAHPYTADEQDQVRRYLRSHALGDAATVAAQLHEWAHACGADEVMVMTTTHDHSARCRSYERLVAAM